MLWLAVLKEIICYAPIKIFVSWSFLFYFTTITLKNQGLPKKLLKRYEWDGY